MLTLLYRDPDAGICTESLTAAGASTRLAALPDQGFFWLDLEAPTPEEAALLADHFHFHRLEVEDALEDVHHPKLDEGPEHLFLILHAAPPLEDPEADEGTELDFFISPRWLVTHHSTPLTAVEKTRTACGHHPLYFDRTPGYLAYQLIDRLMEGYDPLLDQLEGSITALEDEVFNDPTPATMQQLFALKRGLLEIRRIVVYQRDVLARLSRVAHSAIGPEMAIYYRDIWDQLTRVLDQAEQMRDELTGIMDAYLSQTSNRLNEIMKFLTAISTLFIPLNFLTGFFGMNFEFMPFLHSQGAFWGLVVLMMTLAWASRWYFARRGWI